MFIQLVTLAPGHFHAALVLKRKHPAIHPDTLVYSPLNADLLGYLERVQQFNTRTENPTRWNVDVRASDDFLDRFSRESTGNTCVIAGQNRPKIDRIRAAIASGRHVLADKPWIIDPADFPKLEAALADADTRKLVAHDMMTERFEITSRLQRELLRRPDLVGTSRFEASTTPTLTLESVHYLKKTVAGRPLVRPEWWFDPNEAGESLADVGTHLADLALWILTPETPIDFHTDLHFLSAKRWPTRLTPAQFTAITGRAEPSAELIASHPEHDPLNYHGNGDVTFRLRGIPVRLVTRWNYEAAPGAGDTHFAEFRGNRATVTVRPVIVAGEPLRHDLFVKPNAESDREALLRELDTACDEWQPRFPGVSVAERGDEFAFVIPDALRTSHEDHFAEVFDEFAELVGGTRTAPPWERANLLAKYFITTQAVAMMNGKAAGDNIR